MSSATSVMDRLMYEERGACTPYQTAMQLSVPTTIPLFGTSCCILAMQKVPCNVPLALPFLPGQGLVNDPTCASHVTLHVTIEVEGHKNSANTRRGTRLSTSSIRLVRCDRYTEYEIAQKSSRWVSFLADTSLSENPAQTELSTVQSRRIRQPVNLRILLRSL